MCSNHGVGDYERNLHYRNRRVGIEEELPLYSIDDALKVAGFDVGIEIRNRI